MFKTVKNTRRNIRRSVSPPVGSDGIAAASTASQPLETLDKTVNSFFNAESANAFLKPWLRLERGLRLQRFRTFADEYPGLSAEEREALLKILVKANDAKVLNTKQQIQYEDGKILSIRGLKMTRIGDAPATFKIETARPTKKKVGSATAVSAAQAAEE
jgi:hypothetical protein